MNKKNIYQNTILSFGFLYAVLGILFMLIHNPMDTEKTTGNIILGFIGFFIFIGIFVISVWYYKSQGEKVSLGKAVKIGVLSGLVGGIILSVYSYFYFTSLHPEALEMALEMAREKLSENDDFTPEMIEKQMQSMKSMMLPIQLISQVFGGMFYGLIGGLLGGFFYKERTEDY